MRAADTNIVVRLLVRDDARQFEQAKAFVSGGAWVSHVVLAEAAWVLDTLYRLEPEEIAQGIDMLLNQRDIALEDHQTVAAALRAFRARPRVGFNDCLILEIARKAGHLPLGTFDRELAKADGTQRV
jgi:predicted nucleic-acid-binding protein